MRAAHSLRRLIPLLGLGIVVSSAVEIRAAGPRPQPAGFNSRASAPAPIQFIDAAGRTVKLDKAPQRIVVVGRGPHIILHLLYMFPEGRTRLVGMESRAKTVSEFLDLIDPDFKAKAMLGVNPGVESIAALHPDLVLAKGAAVERIGEALTKVGVPLAYLNLETPDEFARDTKNLGIVLENEKRAGEIVSFYKSRVDRISTILSGLPAEKKPRVLLVMATDRGGKFALQVPAAVWMQTIQVQIAGGRPVWLEAADKTFGWTIVNLEQIARWDADKVFVVVWASLDPRKTLDSFKTDAQWRRLKAIRGGELYAFPTDVFGWDSPEPRWILGLTWLAGKIHPESFQGVDMTVEIRAFYEQMYGLRPATIDRLLLPRVQMNIR